MLGPLVEVMKEYKEPTSKAVLFIQKSWLMNKVQTEGLKFCVTASLNYVTVKASSTEKGTFFKDRTGRQEISINTNRIIGYTVK